MASNVFGSYPRTRMRRNRRTPWLRALVRETTLSASDFILPIFVMDGEGHKECIPSMPEVCRHSVDGVIDAIGEAMDLGIGAFAVFPCVDPETKTDDCREAFNPDNLICRSVREIKRQVPDAGIICDVALDPFNAKGHDGLVSDSGEILNDESVEVLIKQSLAQVEAGCDVIAPSDMMDGRIGAIRDALDAQGRQDIAIISYAAKYASAFYGPFRDALGSGSALKGDKKTYQMDPANTDEALREVGIDIEEGADMVMVKPGMPYLDVIRRIKETYAVPTLAYHVSGEYAMLKAAVQNGWLDNDKAVLETLLAFKRAGADGVLTYAAVEAAKLLKAGA